MNKGLHSVIINIAPSESSGGVFIKGWAIGTSVLAISDFNAYFEIEEGVIEELSSKYPVIIINEFHTTPFKKKSNNYILGYSKWLGYKARKKVVDYLRERRFKQDLEDLLE